MMPQPIAYHWDTTTLPLIRQMITYQMQVPQGSGLLQHNPGCDISYRRVAP